MPDRVGLIKTVIRELVTSKPFARISEPMVMDVLEQVHAYAEAGREEGGIMAVSNLFHAAHATSVIHGCRKVIDLGCGPATQLVRIAQLNPETQFVGVELSENMIESARSFVRSTGANNVEIVAGNITDLRDFRDMSADGVISTMTLHHLPTLDDLRDCFRQIRRLLKPSGALYLADFGRLKSLDSVHFFAQMHAERLPSVVVQDYEYSLRAAFSLDEYRKLVNEFFDNDVSIRTTAWVPFMIMIKTASHALDEPALARIRAATNVLPRMLCRDLHSLRVFFRLGGLEHDPFKASAPSRC